MKKCTRCGEVKDLTEFYKASRMKDGRDIYCRLCRRSIANAWTRDNIDKERDRWRVYKEQNADAVRASSRQRMREIRAADPKAAAEYARKYRQENPDKVREWDGRKRAKRLAAPGPGVKASEWAAIKSKYHNCCVYCLKPQKRLTMDHITPLAKGGAHSPDNVVPACQQCNASKHAKDVYEWTAEKLQRLI